MNTEQNLESMQVGFNAHRLKKDDPYHKKEIDFVVAANKEMKYDRLFLSRIVDSKPDGTYLDDEGEKIVLSVIQWLGTPVGQGFLDKVSKM